MESGVDSTAGGAIYNSSGVQGIGVADLADSLAAIDEVVFRRGICDMNTLRSALNANFIGYENLRGHCLKAPKYGNDDPRADRFAARIVTIFSDALFQYTNTRGGPYFAGFYSVTAHKAFGESTGALPSGRLAGKPLANGLSPSSGQERLGPTAALNSTAGLDLKGKARNGINVNMMFDKAAISGEMGVHALMGLFQGYFARGGMQVQMNVVDPSVLIEARDNPHNHPWLLVRVSGYSAYFADLSPGMKQEIIERSIHSFEKMKMGR
jgi:formate C-acetyltransferase